MILNTILQKKFDLTLFEMIEVLIFHIPDLYINVEKRMLYIKQSSLFYIKNVYLFQCNFKVTNVSFTH